MTAKTKDLFNDFVKELCKDPDELRKYLNNIRAKTLHHRVLEGTERDQILTLLKLLEPSMVSNNQLSWTAEYEHAGKIYAVTGFPGYDDHVEEIISDDI